MEGQTKTKKNRGREFFSLSSSSRHFLLSLLFYFRRGLHSFCGLRYLLSRSSLNSALPLERSAKRLKRRCRFKTKQHKTHDKTHDKTRWPRRMRSSSPSPDLLFLRAFASPPLPVFRKTRPRPTRPPASVGLAAPSGRQLSAARTPERLLGNRNPGPAAPPARAVAVCSVAAAAVAAGGAADSDRVGGLSAASAVSAWRMSSAIASVSSDVYMLGISPAFSRQLTSSRNSS